MTDDLARELIAEMRALCLELARQRQAPPPSLERQMDTYRRAVLAQHPRSYFAGLPERYQPRN